MTKQKYFAGCGRLDFETPAHGHAWLGQSEMKWKNEAS
jgi:hypothetical protein